MYCVFYTTQIIHVNPDETYEKNKNIKVYEKRSAENESITSFNGIHNTYNNLIIIYNYLNYYNETYIYIWCSSVS